MQRMSRHVDASSRTHTLRVICQARFAGLQNWGRTKKNAVCGLLQAGHLLTLKAVFIGLSISVRVMTRTGWLVCVPGQRWLMGCLLFLHVEQDYLPREDRTHSGMSHWSDVKQPGEWEPTYPQVREGPLTSSPLVPSHIIRQVTGISLDRWTESPSLYSVSHAHRWSLCSRRWGCSTTRGASTASEVRPTQDQEKGGGYADRHLFQSSATALSS